jgi:hypothetical protein
MNRYQIESREDRKNEQQLQVIPEEYSNKDKSDEIMARIRETERKPPYEVCRILNLGCMESVCQYGRGCLYRDKIKSWYDSNLRQSLELLNA